jgi:acyl carrier protein
VDTFEEIQTIVSASLGVPTSSVHPDSKATDFSGWDSVHHLVLIMDLEQKFGIKFSLSEIAELDSIEKIAKAVEKRVKT